MKNIFSFILIMLLSIGSEVFAQMVETHEFGTLNTQYYIYSDGRVWKFAAQNTMDVKYVEVKSVLASASRGTFHIEISIRNNLIAKWDQLVLTTTYLPYIHTKEVTYSLAQGDTIYYKIYGNQFWTAEGGLLGINYVKLFDKIPTDVELVDTAPSEFMLSQNYPNPFNPVTKIRYSLPQSSFISIKVYDILGKEVSTLVNQYLIAGEYEVEFNASNLPSGVYIYKLLSGNYVKTRKLLFLK